MICKTCKEDKEASSEFFPKHNSTRSGFDTECKVCVSIRRRNNYLENKERILEKRKIYREKNLEKIKAAGRSYSLKNKDKRRVAALIGTYKVDESFISTILNSQLGCCKICKESLIYPESTRSYAVDHDHNTGKIRGLLCHNCNIALGLLKENKNSVIGMLEYIEECC